MAPSALSRFPAEMIEAIVEDVPKADLPSVRFLGRKFSEIAAPKLFSAIPLWTSIKSLKNLTNLASHTQLREYVKEIVFSPLRFIEQEDGSAYFAGIKEALEYEYESASITSLRYGQHQTSYHGYIKAQKYLEKGSSALHPHTISLRTTLLFSWLTIADVISKTTWMSKSWSSF